MINQTTQVAVQSKLPRIGPSIFSVMSELAAEHKAINLSQGFPNFPASKELIDLVGTYMDKGFNQYAPAAGVPELREILADKIEKSYNRKVNHNTEITITAGATQAIFTTIISLIKEGDEVMVFEPAYDSYIPSIKMAGGMPIKVALTGPDYKIPWAEVKNKISFKTRMIILNTPHNPTGTIIDEEDIKQLKIITEGNDIIILSDEVYEHAVFDDQKHISILQTSLFDRCVSIYSFGKVLHTTGWKIGYCVAPEYLMNEFRKVHQFNVFAVNTPIQHAIADYYKKEENYLSVSPFYQQKRDYFLELLKDSKFEFIPSSGTYFQLLKYSEISDLPDEEFAKMLTIEHKVASIPISVFYTDKFDAKVLRFCFAKTNETLEKAAERLCKI